MVTLSLSLGLLAGLHLLGSGPEGPPHRSLEPMVPQRIKLIGTKATPGNAEVTSLTITVPPGGVPAGRRLVARLSTGTETGPVSASDSRGNTWTKDADKADPSLLVRAVVLSAHVTLPLAQGETITIQFPSVGNAAVIVEEYAGVAPSDAVDHTSGASGASATASVPTLTSVGAKELLVGHITTRGKQNQVTFQAGSGWITGPRQAANTRWALAMHRVTSAAGAVLANATLGVSTDWAAVVVAYRPAEQPVRVAPGVPAPTTTTDLTLLVAQWVSDGSLQWVKERTVGQPPAQPARLDFKWSRPPELVAAATADKAQWQMVAGANPTSSVVFLPTQLGPGSLGYARYSYASVTIAPPGSTGSFGIGAERVPAKPDDETIWVRVVMSQGNRLRASPWVKINVPAPVVTVGVPAPPVPLSIALSEIECVRETDDASPEDEIRAFVMSADLAAGTFRIAYTGLYNFDQDDSQLDRKWPNLGVWGTGGAAPAVTPAPIAASDAAVVIVELVEHDGSGIVSKVMETTLLSVMGAKLAALRKASTPRPEMIKQLRAAFRDNVKAFIADPSDSELFATGWHSTEGGGSAWDFTALELQRARSGEAVERVLTFRTTQPDEIIPTVSGELGLGDDSEYRVRFRMTKPTVSAQ